MSSTAVLEAVERILNRGGDADDVLRAVVTALVERAGVAWAGISFVDAGALVPGPTAGAPDPGRRSSVPISYAGERIGELAVDAARVDGALLDRIALLISPYCLVGWDTAGEPWTP